MKKQGRLFHLVFIVFLFLAAGARAVTFTNNTSISPLDTSYDGADIVVSNCTVTVDGAHSFNSLLVGAGGALTHSFLPSGNWTLWFNVTNEPQVLTSTNPVTLVYSNVSGLVTVTDTNSLLNYSNGVDFVQLSPGGGLMQISRTETSSIPDGATVLVSYTWYYTYGPGLYLNLTNDLNVAAGGSINANAIGYGPANGTGHGFSSSGSIVEGSGASHAGRGGSCSSNATVSASYGTLYQPTTLGSGGGASYAGSGGSGGGRIQITAGGTVNIDGVISANGADATNSRAGGGSGGSIWIVATNNFSGAGSLIANGGAGEPIHGGGGGGGRIAVQCGTNNFSGSLTAYGGNGWKIGGAGTVFIQTNGQTGLLVLDNGGRSGTNSTVNLSAAADVVVRNGAWLTPGSFIPRNLTIGTNGTLSPASASLNLTVGGDCIIQPGGSLMFDALGSGPGTGAGYAFSNYYCGYGASHGGYGAVGNATGGGMGSPFDSITTPTGLGLGGGNYSSAIGGAGGGALQLNVTGTLQVDGRISANAGNGSVSGSNGGGGGGGSGGSIYIVNCSVLAGSGSITANGGNGVALFGGGGGGGRIAINAGSNNFTGKLSAAGGSGFGYGGAGTIYTQIGGAQQLILDNAGHLGTNTPVSSASTVDLIVQNGARATAGSSVTFNNLVVNSNGWLTHVPASSLNLVILNNVTIQPGGGFMGDFLGRSAGQGSASGGTSGGSTSYYLCGGGGYGGKGGNAALVGTYSGSGGVNNNDSAVSPSSSYSGSGGGTYSTYSIGGSGGGFLQLTVNGTLELDGNISANGGNASGLSGGGGAGGGVYLSVGRFSGGGSISVNGGTGASNFGGGGGGGRIAINFNTNNFIGALTAFGGAGANYGGGGTIYLKTNSVNHAQVIVDNAGHAGADTIWNSSSATDLILRNGSSCYVSGSPVFNNLTIGSNCWLFASNGSPSSATVYAANITVQPGGGISADLAGYNANAGYSGGVGGDNSTLPYYPCGGGAHGGYGGASLSGLATGGTYYDSPSAASIAGSGGGSFSTASIGGKGGGAVNFSVSGNLQMDGTLSANGGNGSGDGGGGGAGGSLNISCTTLAGVGSIAANGGNGVGNIGGGGAGGMIFASFTSNLFSGTLSAVGGGGANYGGAGTLYLRNNFNGQTSLIADNAGHRGANTPLTTANSWIIRNGAVAQPASQNLSISSLLITSNAWLLPVVNSAGNMNLTVTGNATVQPGGGIYTDGYGSAQTTGTGHGGYAYALPYYPCSGGAHGGYGAFPSLASVGNYNGIPLAYDSTTAPSATGSGGGGYSTYSIGGSGGGYVRLTVNGTLQMDGSISANGGNAAIGGGGGGSGGSIYLIPGTLAGAGSISANGGNGASYGGGGGGGRIAVYFSSNNFTGTISAFGGGGYAYGGAGTIYTKTNSQNYGQLLLDNGNNAGANTAFDFNNLDVTVQKNAIGQLPASGSWSAHNVLIHTNGALIGPGSIGLINFSANNLTIDAGGALAMDSAGYGSGSGPGWGNAGANLRGGGGFGGFGGGNISGRGGAYGSIFPPTTSGSGGASYGSPPYDAGGWGGGALQLNVSGLLTVNGRLSANGGNGDNVAGGGSGGSLFLSSISRLAGSGVISANGGAGGSASGGGGGGRIALVCNFNSFTGQFTAFGGNGIFPGGAGTIYSFINGAKAVTVDNGGLAGTNTPLGGSIAFPSGLFDLNIANAASVIPTLPLPLFNNFNLAAGSTLLVPAARTQLFIAAKNNVNLAGILSADFLGYAQTNGPGAGTNVSLQGSGGGYGGAGGNSASGAVGGTTNGSASQPVDFGSGGGYGANTIVGGSEGGGAIRISAGGTLNIDGTLSANGDYGWQDNSGGGAGGSLWLAANTVTGLGTISAAGGNGDLWNGGGGGGGRIAIYSPTNLFAGTTNVSGGLGAMNGQSGTIFLSSSLLDFNVIAQSPTGTVSNTVSYVDLTFSDAVDPASANAGAFTLTTPAGALPTASLTATAISATAVRVGFPVQNLLGNYSIQAAFTIASIFGQPLQNYSGNFAITLPTISGTVSDTNGAPVAGVTVQPDGGLIGATTDAGGNYSLGVPPGWSGTVTPALGTLMFVPGALSYTNLSSSLTNQNFLMVPSLTPTLATSLSGTNLSLSWTSIPGVTYQALWSTNLADWQPLGSPLPGTNGLMQIPLPLTTDPAVFFRLSATH